VASTAPLMRSTGPSFGCHALVGSTAPEVRLLVRWWNRRALVPLPRPGALHRPERRALAVALRCDARRWPETRLPRC
jgi:hypothetical protein